MCLNSAKEISTVAYFVESSQFLLISYNSCVCTKAQKRFFP
ncbi:hypothetical protein FDUTEX481_01289 [Tolypothrix sp. PCC 7601]|nr:hypothetical protein FDUTEX481_01289 [Tolypothrix sp. PCC 7601]